MVLFIFKNAKNYLISCSKLSNSGVEKNSPKEMSKPSQSFLDVLLLIYILLQQKNIEFIISIRSTHNKMEINIIIDSLTNCLICSETGEEFDTEFHEISVDSKYASELQKNGWKFDWSVPAKEGYSIYALYLKGDKVVQGLIALKHIVKEYYTFVDLLESAPYNIGQKGKYKGVGAHLFAIACKLSWNVGNEGYVQFIAKTNLIEHYAKSVGAKLIENQAMYIDSYNSIKLIKKYFKEE